MVECILALSENASIRQVAMLTMQLPQHFTNTTSDSIVKDNTN